MTTSENLYKLASYIESKPEDQFNIDLYRVDKFMCGTIACVAGWADLLAGKPYGEDFWEHDQDQLTIMVEYYGLTMEEADNICLAPKYYARNELPNQANAVKHLRRLAAEYAITEGKTPKPPATPTPSNWKLNKQLELVEA